VHRVLLLMLQLHHRPAAKAAAGLVPPLLPLHRWLWGQAAAGPLPLLLPLHQRLPGGGAAGVRPCGADPATYASLQERAFHPMQLQLDAMSNLILETCGLQELLHGCLYVVS
jgi:hypothetical protein